MKKTAEQKIDELKSNQAFIDFYCFREDKWLQNANWDEKIKAIFGTNENAVKEFEKDSIFNEAINLK